MNGILDSRNCGKESAGVIIDTGTGKRIPFARKVNFDTGEYEALVEAPNGTDVLCGEDNQPLVVKGRATGKLQLVSLDQAELFGRKPVKVQSPIEPMTADQKREGLDTYREVYFDIWKWRGDSTKVVNNRWEEFLKQNDFLDCFLLRRVHRVS